MIISINELALIREKHKNQRIVYCDGVFDLTHAGHVLFFEDCKKHGDILVVMVGNDFNLRLYKGEERPILNEHLRLKMVDSFKPVDYAFLDIDAPHKDFLALKSDVIFKTLKPNFYIINTDAYDMPRRYELVKGFDTKLVILKRTCFPEFEEISTTRIINKIKSLSNKEKGAEGGNPTLRPKLTDALLELDVRQVRKDEHRQTDHLTIKDFS